MISIKLTRFFCGTAVALGLFCFPGIVVAQYNQWLNVDCSGTDLFSYPSISAAMPYVVDHTANRGLHQFHDNFSQTYVPAGLLHRRSQSVIADF
jgi:hypothetical protein